MSKLAILGGKKVINESTNYMFKWPVVTAEDENAVLDVLRKGSMSGVGITVSFEKEFAQWTGAEYALGYCNGTSSIHAALWACGVGAGDEIICPSMTYWASCSAALSLGAAVNFADIDPTTLCINPTDIEHRIGPRTKAIVVVHYGGHPCDMNSIMAIARKHNIMVIEDVSHAHGALYKGKQCGTIGDIAGFSMMAGKAFAIGEGGMMVTNNRHLYERCIAFGHYERTINTSYSSGGIEFCDKALTEFSGVPLGGFKHRMNQTCSAMGRVQLKYYPARMKEIQNAMNYFWDMLEGLPGIRAHRNEHSTESTMGGWYNPKGLYKAEELDGLSCEAFCDAITAEGVSIGAGANAPLHLHPMFHKADLFNMGRPTMISFGQRDVRQGVGTLPVSERINEIAFSIPWFKYFDKDIINKYASAFHKVIDNYRDLL